MIFENTVLDSFSVAGISVRTTNKDGQSQKDIGGLWGKFMNDNLAHKIPNRTSNELYCIYTDYEGDYMGTYTTILGYKVSSTNIPEGLVVKTIPASSYRMYQSTGELPGSVVNTWKHIWESNTLRKYLADFDVYPEDAFTSVSPVVKTYVSV